MKARIEYSKAKQVDIIKIPTEQTYPQCLTRFLLIIFLISYLIIQNEYACYSGLALIFIIYLSKLVYDKKRNEQFLFLPEPDSNYIEIPYKTKLQAIDAKITCYLESNPVKIMQDESNRLYLLSNSSGSLFTLN